MEKKITEKKRVIIKDCWNERQQGLHRPPKEAGGATLLQD